MFSSFFFRSLFWCFNMSVSLLNGSGVYLISPFSLQFYHFPEIVEFFSDFSGLTFNFAIELFLFFREGSIKPSGLVFIKIFPIFCSERRSNICGKFEFLCKQDDVVEIFCCALIIYFIVL